MPAPLRSAFALLAALAAAPPAAALDCPMEHAVYSEPENGFSVVFRPLSYPRDRAA